MSSTMLCLASISTLCCISADRYFAVVKPMRYKHVLTPKKALYMLVLVWLGSLSIACLHLVTSYEFHPGMNHCSPAWHRSCGLYAFMTIFAFGIPLITLLSTYGMIFSSIRRHARRVSHWRASTSGSSGKQDSCAGQRDSCARVLTDITGREFDSFLSNSAVEEEQQRNFNRLKELYADPNNTLDNSVGDLRAGKLEQESTKPKVLESQHEKRFRSHSAGCQHARPDENLLPLFLQMKSAASQENPVENSQEPVRRRSCSVSVRFSINGLVPGTVSAFFCPADNHGNMTRSLSLSYCNINSLDHEQFSSDPQPLSTTNHTLMCSLPSDLNCERIPSHSISLMLTTASTPVSPDLNIPTTFSVNGFTPQKDRSTGKLQAMPRRSDGLKTGSNFKNCTRNSNHLQLPPIAIPANPVNPVQLVKASLPEPVPRPKSRSLSLSFGTLPDQKTERRNASSLKVPPPTQKITSPLLRLRAISKFKSRLRVNTIPREYKIAKIGFILVLVFFLSWGPYMMVHNCQPSPNTPLWVYRMAMWLIYLSCVLNPIMYALSSKHIRTAFSSHMKCCKTLYSRRKLTVVRHRSATFPDH